MKQNIGALMRQAQQIQANLQKAQEELAQLEVTGESGGGMVKVVMTGDGGLKSLHIDPEVVDREDVEMLQDLIVAAVNEGKRRAGELAAAEMQKAAGGMGLPPGLF